MKPFNLEEALAGKPVVTREGTAVGQVVLFTGLTGGNSRYPVVAVIEGWRAYFTKEGTHAGSVENRRDLFMASEHREGWVNVYAEPLMTGIIFASKEEAIEGRWPGCVDTVKIEWEE